MDKIPDKVLFERLRRIIAIEAMSGLLKNLTPEEEKTFESACHSLFTIKKIIPNINDKGRSRKDHKNTTYR